MDVVNGTDRRVPPAFLAVGFGVALVSPRLADLVSLTLPECTGTPQSNTSVPSEHSRRLKNKQFVRCAIENSVAHVQSIQFVHGP